MHAARRRFAIFATMLMTAMGLVSAAAMAAAPLAGVNAGSSAWRCGSDGRIYTDTPCAGGRAIELPPPRPASDVAAAQRLAEREKLQAERMRRDRERREAAAIAASSHLVSLGPARAAVREPLNPRATLKTQKPRLAKKPAQPRGAPGADEQTWRATAPASPRIPG